MENEIEKLDNIEVEELGENDLEDASGGLKDDNNGCNGNCNC